MLKKDIITAVQMLIDSQPMATIWPDHETQILGEYLSTTFLAVKKMPNAKYSNDTRHMWNLRENGEWESFSWRKMISPVSEAAALRNTMRSIVAPDTDEVRCVLIDTHGACENCGADEIALLQADHVDPPFLTIASRWIEQNGMVATVKNDNQVGYRFVEEALEADWITYHSSHAVYQLLCRSCNASKGAR